MPVKAIPAGYHSVTPYLAVRGGAQAIDFYKRAFGAKERMRLDAPGDRVGHAELQIGDSVVMVADEYPNMNFHGPAHFGGSPVNLHLYVEDVDASFRRATQAGAQSVREPEDQFYGDRTGTVRDPFGHTWHLATHTEDVSMEELEKRARAKLYEKPPTER